MGISRATVGLMVASSVWIIYAAQLLQFLEYGIFIAASVYYAAHVMEQEDAVKRQSFVTGMLIFANVIASVVVII